MCMSVTYTQVICLVIMLGPAVCDAKLINSRPVIGVLAQSCNTHCHDADTYIHSTYVKWLESGGALVVPIRVKESDEYYETIFKSINGLVFPGGDVDLMTSYYAKAAKPLYNMAVKANDDGDYFPLWGTCLGLQELAVFTCRKNIRSYRHAHRMLPLKLASDFGQSRLFGDLPKDIQTSLKSFNVTANYHNYGLSPLKFSQNQALRSFYRILSTNVADNGKDFISTLEAINYPFYGSQWHPEKIPYDWDLTDVLSHTKRGVQVSHYIADFFVEECRKSGHHFPDTETELSAVINNYRPHFSRDETFDEHYFINFTHPTV